MNGILAWARGQVDEYTIARSGQAIEDMQFLIYHAGGSDKRQTICNAIKTLFEDRAPVKCDQNFLSAVLHVKNQVDKWLLVAMYLPAPIPSN